MRLLSWLKSRARASHPGNVLVTTLMLFVTLTFVAASLFTYHMLFERVVQARNSISATSLAAESAARTMAERLVGVAALELGDVDAADLAALEADLESITLPAGTRLDTAESGYRMVAVRDSLSTPYDQPHLSVTSDWPRTSYAVPPRLQARELRDVRVVEVRSTVRTLTGASRSATLLLAIGYAAPHQNAIYGDGDVEMCVTGGAGAVSGRVEADGALVLRCSKTLTYAGELLASDDITVTGNTHRLTWDGGSATLTSQTRTAIESDPAAALAAWGGRVRVASGLGAHLGTTRFQTPEHAGSGECSDFDAACAGAGVYFPSAQVQRVTSGPGSEFDLRCGYAYGGSDCSSLTAGIRYVPFPFTTSAPIGTARFAPGDPTWIWKGLFADPRREARCTAQVNDSTSFRTFRCPTNPYGFVIDLSQLPGLPGGLLSVLASTQTNTLNNESGFQEIVFLENAQALAGPLTIHSELPVYIKGSFNSLTRLPAMIDAPLITVLPQTAGEQLTRAQVWDSTAITTPDHLDAQQPVQIVGVLRSNYERTQSGYYGGTFEQIPSVLGDWSQTTLEVLGAVEGREVAPGSPGSFSSAFAPYGSAPSEMETLQPSGRRIIFDRRLLSASFQPPGSWNAANTPPAGAGGTRTPARQANAAGGAVVVHTLSGFERSAPQD